MCVCHKREGLYLEKDAPSIKLLLVAVEQSGAVAPESSQVAGQQLEADLTHTYYTFDF